LARDPTAGAKDEEGDDEEEMLAARAIAKDDMGKTPGSHGWGWSFLGAMVRDGEGGEWRWRRTLETCKGIQAAAAAV